jgi:hypothetical protein
VTITTPTADANDAASPQNMIPITGQLGYTLQPPEACVFLISFFFLALVFFGSDHPPLFFFQ